MPEHKAVIEAEVKALADTDDAPHGSFEMVLSSPTLDMDGEIVMPKAFEPLPAKISVDIDHGLSVKTLVGSGKPYYDGDVLKIKGTFASTPLGQEVRTLVKEGHLTMSSVVMLNAERDMKSTPPRVMKARLLNATFAQIGKNADALVLSAKAYSDAEDAAREETKSLIREVLDERDRGLTKALSETTSAPLTANGDQGILVADKSGNTFSLNTTTDANSAFVTKTWTNVPPDVDLKAGARNSAKDIQRIQTMHDHAVDLGATCKAAEKSVVEGENVETKAIIGNSLTDTPVEDGIKPPDETSDDVAVKAIAAEAEALELMRMELELL